MNLQLEIILNDILLSFTANEKELKQILSYLQLKFSKYLDLTFKLIKPSAFFIQTAIS